MGLFVLWFMVGLSDLYNTVGRCCLLVVGWLAALFLAKPVRWCIYQGIIAVH